LRRWNRQIGWRSAGIAGATGDAAGVPVTTWIAPVAGLSTTRSMRGLPTGAAIVPVFCAAISVSTPPIIRAPASTRTVMFGVVCACGRKATAMRSPATMSPSIIERQSVQTCCVLSGRV
jgi:hypothetical protein